MNNSILTRAMSGFPLSVGTGLAFESLFEPRQQPIDMERIIPQKINITDYQSVWINLTTLFRNLFSSVVKEESAKILPHDWAEAMIQEIEFIQELISTESLSQTRTYFYISEYRDINGVVKQNSYYQLRQDNTLAQKQYTGLQNDTIELVLRHYKESDNFQIFSNLIKPKTRTKSLIITHVAYDLLSHASFVNLDLLESHTGVLKSKHVWYTKYSGGKELTMMPFNKGLLMIFGDSQTFRPLDIRLRRAIIELAIEKHWTPVTTIAKIKSDLSNMKQFYYAEVVKHIFD